LSVRLWIVRHGKAERGSATGRDAERALREKGHRQAAWLGEVMSGRDDRPVVVVSSGLVRADETAAHLADALGVGVEREGALRIGVDEEDAVAALDAWAQAGVVAAVGHNPQISRLAALLGAEGAGGEMRTGEAALVETPLPLRPHAGVTVGRFRYDADADADAG